MRRLGLKGLMGLSRRMRITEVCVCVCVPGMMPSRLVLAATRVLMRMLLSRRGGVSARMPLGQYESLHAATVTHLHNSSHSQR